MWGVRLSLVPFLLLPILFVDAQNPKDRDFKELLPRIPPRTPVEALKAFKLRPGFAIELVAAEPLIKSPVALDIDENGRMFVVEFPEYNQETNKDFKQHGVVRLLEDTNGDGAYDKSTVYADGLEAPVAVVCYDGGVFVGAVPDIWYFKDTRKDGKADVRRRIFTGFGRDKAGEGMFNSFHWGLDNRIHVATSIAGGTVRQVEDKGGKPFNVRGFTMLFDPRPIVANPPGAAQVELTSGGGQHGMSMDDWGLTFVCGNSDPMHVMMYDSRYVARNPYLAAPSPAINILVGGRTTKLHRTSPVEPWRALRTKLRKEKLVPGSDEGGTPSGFFTAATGITVYRGDAWPEEYRGNVFVGEVSNNIVFRAQYKPKGTGWVGHPAEKDVEFLSSSDNWFRPVQFANAPDGSLLVLDMYRELIEGAAFLPPSILKHMDVGAGVDRGRIYRIVPEKFKRPPLPKLGAASTAELVALLDHANGWHRDTASRLLYQRQDPAAISLLLKLAEKSKTTLGRLHALYALDGQGALKSAHVLAALKDSQPRMRQHGLRLAERFQDVPAIRGHLESMVNDADLHVRYQLAFTLGNVGGPLATKTLATLAKKDGADSWFRLAELSSSHKRAGELFALLVNDEDYRKSQPGQALLGALATQIGAGGGKDQLALVIQSINLISETDKALSQQLVRSLVSKQSAVASLVLKGVAGSKVEGLLADLIRDARATALADKAEASRRVAAIRTLGLVPFAEVKKIFVECLQTRQPQPIQAAALETLGRFHDPEVASLVLSAWPGLSPGLRATAAETLFSRPVWIAAFLDAVEKNKIGRGDVDPARLQLLQSLSDPMLKSRAAKLLQTTKLSGRKDIVAAYQKALELKGDAVRGKAIFKKDCSACHKLQGVGNEVGADLSAVRNRGNDAILLNVLDPNREVLPQFLTYVLVTDAGRTLTGMITAESATSITLRRPDGTSETVLRVNIDELRSTGMSFMPEGLEKQVDVQGMADLLAYLNSIP